MNSWDIAGDAEEEEKEEEKKIFPITVTLNEGQGHLNWYQNVELSGLYHHTYFERNRLANVWIQANINFFKTNLYKQGPLPWKLNDWDQMRMRFIIPTSLNSRPNSNQIDLKLRYNWRRSFCFTVLLWPWIKVKVSWTKRREQLYLSSYQIWIKLILKYPNACHC